MKNCLHVHSGDFAYVALKTRQTVTVSCGGFCDIVAREERGKHCKKSVHAVNQSLSGIKVVVLLQILDSVNLKCLAEMAITMSLFVHVNVMCNPNEKIHQYMNFIWQSTFGPLTYI